MGNNTSITCIEKESIDDEMTQQMYEIEKDIWASHLGEYTKCNDCGNVYSKEQIWKNIPLEYKNKTVSLLERELGDNLNCNNCSGTTEYIFGEDYKGEIKKRQKLDGYLLSIYKDKDHRILGFCDGYVAPFDDIYQKEFVQYYESIGIFTVKQKIMEILPDVDMDRLFCPTFTGITQGHANMNTIHQLISNFYEGVNIEHGSINGVYEAILGSTLHAFYSVVGGNRIYASEDSQIMNTHKDIKSDIFIHPDITGTSMNRLDSSFRKFFGKNKEQMREIIEKGTQ